MGVDQNANSLNRKTGKERHGDTEETPEERNVREHWFVRRRQEEISWVSGGQWERRGRDERKSPVGKEPQGK